MPQDPSQQALKQESRLKVDFREISLTGSTIYSGAGIVAYNPDSLVGKKGLEIYKKMLDDDQIKAVLSMKKFARLMTTWEIQPASQDAMDVEVADFVKTNLQNMVGTFEDNLLNIYTALDYGYSVTEKIWYRIEKGKYAGKIGLKELKTREPFYYGFEIDEFGNLPKYGVVYQGPTPTSLTKDAQKTLTENVITSSGYGYKLPTDKFVIYSYNKEFSNWYGRSDLRAAYRSWWSKDLLLRFMNIYLERFGMPTHVGKFPKGTSKTDRDNLKNVLDKVQSKYAITIPEDVSIELLNAGAGGGDAFKNAIEMHNKFISRSILVPDLMGFNEISGGAYALGKKHFDVFLWILQKLGRDTEESIVGEQIIKQLVDYNYSNVTDYPKFKFESITAEGTATRANIIQMGVTGGFINPAEEWIREYLALPKSDPSKPLGIPSPLPGMQSPQNAPGGQTLDGQPADGAGLKDQEDVNADAVTSVDGEPKQEFTVSKEYKEACKLWATRNAKVSNIATKKFAKVVNGKELTTDKRFDYKIDFAKMKEDLEEYEKETVDELSKIVQQQKDVFLKQVEKKQLVDNKDYNAVNSLQLKFVGDFKTALQKRLIKLYLDSKLEVLREVQKGADGNIDIVTKFANTITIQPWIPVEPTDAVDFFNKKVTAKVVNEDGTKTLLTLAKAKELKYYDATAFAIAGIERDNILKQAKFIILNGIKNGDAKGTQFALGKMFDTYLTTGEIEDDELVTPHRLETIVRTNFSEALNAGRLNLARDPDLEGFVQYYKYSAIMDDRVRPSHAEMNNKIFRADDPVIDRINPPNGYQCRCLLVPVTKIEVDRLKEDGEGIEVSTEDDLPEDFPDVGFGKYQQDLSTIADLKLEPSGQIDLNVEIQNLQTQKTDLENKIAKLNEELAKQKTTLEQTRASNIKISQDVASRCPYSNCGSSDLELLELDRFGTYWIRCNQCRNEFKITQEKQIYLFDKIKNSWQLQNNEKQPSNISGEISMP